MKKSIFHLCICFILTTITWGCRKESNNQPLSLNEKEIYSECVLSSISPDGDSACFIGNEKGDIYRYDQRSGSFFDTLRTGTDRIYSVTARKNDKGTYYFVGVRNTGLFMYRYDREGKPVPERHFLIQDRNVQYSAYNTMVCGDRIYTVTSHGLFYKDLTDAEGGDVLKRLYPTSVDGSMNPFPTTGMLRYGPHIYAASAGGLLKCDVGTNKTEVWHRGENINSAMLVDGNIYSLSGKNLYIDSPDGSRHETYRIPVKADIYYHVDDTHYFIGSDRVTVVHDRDLKEGKNFRTIPLRRNVRPDCRNIIMADSISRHSLLVTENALFRIPFHLDVFNTDGKTTTACSEGDYVYFVTNNNLFRMRDNDSEAKRIADLPKEDRIKNAIVCHNTLYYVNGKTELKRKKISDTFAGNNLTGNPEKVFSTSRGITAAGKGADGHIYAGIRDSLLLLNDNKTVTHVTATEYPFVNRIIINGKNRSTYAALLNGGVVRLNGDKASIENGTVRHNFIRDIAFASFSAKPCILTNHFLFSPNDKDSVEAEGFSRLLTADGKNFYALKENGIRKYVIDRSGIRHTGDTLGDIRFSPDISLVHKGSIYFGSEKSGIIKLKADGTWQWVKFNHDVYTLDYVTLLLLFVIVVIAAGLILWKQYRRLKKSGLLFSDWLRIRKSFVRNNPDKVKALETEIIDNPDNADLKLAEGKAWMESYETVKRKADTYKALTKLDALTLFGKELRTDIYMLSTCLNNRNVDIEKCKKLCDRIESGLRHMDMCGMAEAIGQKYREYEQTVNDMYLSFAERLRSLEQKWRVPCDSAECAGKRLAEANEMYLWVKAAECVTKIKEILNATKPLTDESVKKTVNEYMTELYYALSQDTFVATRINIKAGIERADISMTIKEKMLMLLIAAPDTKADIMAELLYSASVSNVRSTRSKVKKDLESIGEEKIRELYAQQDGPGGYILRTVLNKQ